MLNLSSFTHPHVVPKFFMILNTKEDVCNQTIDGKAIDFHSWKKIVCKSIGGVNCLVFFFGVVGSLIIIVIIQ